jgi:signal transduction histidine kinase
MKNIDDTQTLPCKSKLLFIDDDFSVLASLRLLFASDYETFYATSAAEGIRVFEEAHPDIVILDLRLPDKSGIEALRRIRRLSPKTSVIILTGFSTRLDAEESLRLGAVDYLNKPFDSHYLKSRIAEISLTSLHHKGDEMENKVIDQILKNISEFQELRNASAAFLHDVAGPLTSLTVASEMLGSKLDEGNELTAEEISTLISQTTDSVRYVNALVEQWRSFSKLRTLMQGRFKVQDSIDFALAQVMKKVSLTDIVLQIHTQDSGKLLPGNLFAIGRVLINLLNNAVDAVSSVYGRIHLTASNSEEGFQFIISDNGPGIDGSQISQIFKPSYTTKSTGRGLGLYISDKMIEALGGTMTVRSPGKMMGTDFIVTIPNR